MTTKEWLNRAWNIEQEIMQLKDAQQRAFGLAVNTVGVLKEDKVQESRQNSSENKFILYSDFSELIELRKKELCQIQKEVFEAINQIENGLYRSILLARHINCKTWEEISVEINYSYKHIVHELYPKALKDVTKCNIM